MTVWFRALAIAVFPIVAMAQVFLEGNAKIADDLQMVDPSETIDVIVQYKAKTFEHVAGLAHARHTGLRDLVDKGPLRLIHSEVLSVRALDLRLIADDPEVEFISPDRAVHAL